MGSASATSTSGRPVGLYSALCASRCTNSRRGSDTLAVRKSISSRWTSTPTQRLELPDELLAGTAAAGFVVVVGSVVVGPPGGAGPILPSQARIARGGAMYHFSTGTYAPGPMACRGSPTHTFLAAPCLPF